MITTIEVEVKVCARCKIEKSVSKFSKCRSRDDGLQAKCKFCTAEYYQTNQKTKILEHQKSNKKRRATIRGYLQDVFGDMKRRCTNPKIHNYNRYGGRNIQVKFKSFNEFADYVVNELKVDPRGKPPLQIDRIDNDGDYKPGNIRFVTCKENNNNRSNNRKKIKYGV